VNLGLTLEEKETLRQEEEEEAIMVRQEEHERQARAERMTHLLRIQSTSSPALLSVSENLALCIKKDAATIEKDDSSDMSPNSDSAMPVTTNPVQAVEWPMPFTCPPP
jgi:hypothetical protein